MNSTTFNDRFALLNKIQFGDWVKAPLIHYKIPVFGDDQNLANDAGELLRFAKEIDRPFERLPFHNFRMCCENVSTTGKVVGVTNAVVSSTAIRESSWRRALAERGMPQGIPLSHDRGVCIFFEVFRNGEHLPLSHLILARDKDGFWRKKTLALNGSGGFAGATDFREIAESMGADIPHDFEERLVIFPMRLMAADFLHPHSFICRVHPNKPGKSVTWTEQRTHYTIVHKSHPANRADAARVIQCDERRHIQRMAHARRAHFRLLRSPKFKNKVGQRVFVKATWCGPKEWEDASGQIYRIVEKPKQ